MTASSNPDRSRERLSPARRELLQRWLEPRRGMPSSSPADLVESFTLFERPGEPRPLLRLPNGLEIAFQSVTEARHLYTDVFEHGCYLRHGVTLPADAVVFDVGANIGLFSLFVGSRAPRARIFAWEPAPPLFEILSHNTRHLSMPPTLLQCGASRAPGTAQLTFYPHSSGMSTFEPNLEEEQDVLRRLLRYEAVDAVGDARALAGYSEELLDERFQSRMFTCQLRTVSEIIAVEQLECIDLLKIDVQKSELDVLLGIHPAHWDRIRQVVLEVHDLQGRLDDVRRLLHARGFQVELEQADALRGSVLFNVYAIRAT